MKNINWADHLANLIVVILGISIAFYLENYREGASLKKQEQEYLHSLLQDLRTDIEALDTLMSINDMMVNAAVKVSNATIGQPYGTGQELTSYVLLLQYNPPFTAQRSTYESLKASGKMDLIADFSLRNSVVELYEQNYRGAIQYDNALKEHSRDFIKPYFMKKIRYNSTGTLDPQFLADGEFKNIIFSYRFLFIAKNDFYKQVKGEVEGLVNALGSYLEE